jgi:hypothetical protein
MSVMLDYVFGCRSSSSKYARDGALVVCKIRGVPTITIAIFENGMDFIGHPATYADAVAKYKEYTNVHGWHPMDIDDLVKTAIDRCQIDEATMLVPL